MYEKNKVSEQEDLDLNSFTKGFSILSTHLLTILIIISVLNDELLYRFYIHTTFFQIQPDSRVMPFLGSIEQNLFISIL